MLGFIAFYAIIAWIVLAGRNAYAAGIASPNWGAIPVTTPVRVIIYFLALAAIGWFVSRIDTNPNSHVATAPTTETISEPNEAAPPIPLARPKLDGGDTTTVLAAETMPAPTEGAPPRPPAKPELDGDDTTTVLDAETTPTPSEGVPPTPPAKPELDSDDTTTVLAAETTPAPTTALAGIGMGASPAVEMTMAPTKTATPALLADAGDYVERRNGETIVDVPTTRVETSGDKKTRVRVRAPYTKVDVDTKRRLVRIRVPYYNGDIRW